MFFKIKIKWLRVAWVGRSSFVGLSLVSRFLKWVVSLAHHVPFAHHVLLSLGSYKADLSHLLPLQLNSRGRFKQL